MTTHDTPDTLRLTAEEREQMRSEMRGFMAQHPVRQRMPFFSPRFLRLATPVAALVLLCGGTAFAAEGALPDEALYPVKVAVIEPLVAGALSYSATSEARVNGALAGRRLQETETLIARDRLDPETAAGLQARITRHADAAHAALAEAAAGGDALEAVRIGTDLEASLDGHSEVIEELAADAPGAAAISAAVAMQADRAGDASDELARELDEVPARDAEAFSAETLAEARDAIAGADEAIADAPASDITLQAKDLLGEARSLASGSGVSSGDAGDDAARAQDALRLARQARIMLESQENLAEE